MGDAQPLETLVNPVVIDRQLGELVHSPNTPMTTRAAAPTRIKGWVLAMLGSLRCTCAWLWSCVTAPLILAPPLLGGSQTGLCATRQIKEEDKTDDNITCTTVRHFSQWILF